MPIKLQSTANARHSDNRPSDSARMPLSDQDVVALFDHLEDLLDAQECDHSFDLTEAFLASNGIAASRVVPWFRQHGVVCDCDVLGNFEFTWRDTE